MSTEPAALDHGAVLHNRYHLGYVLGRGGFGITYLATDGERGDACVVKELAPPGTVRTPDGDLSFAALGPSVAQRLRHQFVQEASFLSRLRVPGIIPIRETWQAKGTSYFTMDFVADAMTLQRLLLKEGRMDASAVLDIVFQLLETLEQVHARGILHRDIKPSNVLIGQGGEVYLIDFGSAREWHADFAALHTIQHTPGYAPLEQLSEQGRRGPATDLYALGALAYALLTGEPPPPATDRANGVPLIPLRSIRPDVEPRVADAIESCLALSLQERPQSAAAFRAMLSLESEQPPDAGNLHILDQAMLRLQRFKFGKRECPGCGGVLEEPRPLRSGVCPVCREGTLVRRRIAERLCPVCRVGALQRISNADPLRICPSCGTGMLSAQGLLKKKTHTCAKCGAIFRPVNGNWVRIPDGVSMSQDEWRTQSGRSDIVRVCDSCQAQFDLQDDERYRQVVPPPKPGGYDELFPDEWARVAAGLDPGAGNLFCEACSADYFAEGDTVTLLDATRDPYAFGERHQGQLLRKQDVEWLAVGKTSGHPGLVCVGGEHRGCGTEFDGVGDVLTLVRSDNVRLHVRQGQSLTLANWCRLGQGLPLFGQEQVLHDQLAAAIREGYVSGELPFDSRDEGVLWRGPATRLEVQGERFARVGDGQFVLGKDGLTFGGMLRKFRMPLETIQSVDYDGEALCVKGSDGTEAFFDLDPVVFTVRLESGRWETTLDDQALVSRWSAP